MIWTRVSNFIPKCFNYLDWGRGKVDFFACDKMISSQLFDLVLAGLLASEHYQHDVFAGWFITKEMIIEEYEKRLTDQRGRLMSYMEKAALGIKPSFKSQSSSISTDSSSQGSEVSSLSWLSQYYLFHRSVKSL